VTVRLRTAGGAATLPARGLKVTIARWSGDRTAAVSLTFDDAMRPTSNSPGRS
jgi:hypothetical protein